MSRTPSRNEREKSFGGPRSACAVAILLSLAGCARQETPAEYRPTVSIKELMDGIVDPSADVIWDAVGTKMTLKGKEERMPRTDEEWIALRRSALQLVEASNLLQIPGRRVAPADVKYDKVLEVSPEEVAARIDRDREIWIILAHGLHDTATAALAAIDARDPVRVLETGSQIDRACESCHAKYLIPPPAALRK